MRIRYYHLCNEIQILRYTDKLLFDKSEPLPVNRTVKKYKISFCLCGMKNSPYDDSSVFLLSLIGGAYQSRGSFAAGFRWLPGSQSLHPGKLLLEGLHKFSLGEFLAGGNLGVGVVL